MNNKKQNAHPKCIKLTILYELKLLRQQIISIFKISAELLLSCSVSQGRKNAAERGKPPLSHFALLTSASPARSHPAADAASRPWHHLPAARRAATQAPEAVTWFLKSRVALLRPESKSSLLSCSQTL